MNDIRLFNFKKYPKNSVFNAMKYTNSGNMWVAYVTCSNIYVSSTMWSLAG